MIDINELERLVNNARADGSPDSEELDAWFDSNAYGLVREVRGMVTALKSANESISTLRGERDRAREIADVWRVRVEVLREENAQLLVAKLPSAEDYNQIIMERDAARERLARSSIDIIDQAVAPIVDGGPVGQESDAIGMIRPDSTDEMQVCPPARIYVSRKGEEYRTGWYYFTGRSGTYDTDYGPSLCFEFEHEYARTTRWGTGCVWMDWGMRTFQIIDQAVKTSPSQWFVYE